MSKYADVDRLEESEIEGVAAGLCDLDRQSREMTGLTIAELAGESVGFASHDEALAAQVAVGDGVAPRVAVIPVTSGYGLIGGFAQTLVAILNHLGANARATDKTDLAGLEEAYRARAQLIFMADDYTFTAVSTRGGAMSDNGIATGRAFGCALAHMARGGEVLVLGAGPVGLSATRYLKGCGFAVSVYDKDPARLSAAVEATGAGREQDGCVARYRNILDATNGADFITAADVTSETRISAPGIPLGPTAQVRSLVPVFHNPLELGTAAMYYDCLHQLTSAAAGKRGAVVANAGAAKARFGRAALAQQVAATFSCEGR